MFFLVKCTSVFDFHLQIFTNHILDSCKPISDNPRQPQTSKATFLKSFIYGIRECLGLGQFPFPMCLQGEDLTKALDEVEAVLGGSFEVAQMELMDGCQVTAKEAQDKITEVLALSLNRVVGVGQIQGEQQMFGSLWLNS